MRSVILYGELANRFGKHHRFGIKTAGEAIRALKANFKGFAPYMCNAHNHNIGFKIFVGETQLSEYDELAHPQRELEAIKIVPVIFGSGSGFVKIFIGAALVVGGIIVSGATFGGAAPLGSAMIAAGIGLAIGGVAQLLTTPPAEPGQSGSTDRKQSFIFSGPTNVSAQGMPVPIGYGRMIVGSAVISAGIETHEE